MRPASSINDPRPSPTTRRDIGGATSRSGTSHRLRVCSATDPLGPTMSVLLSILGGSMSSRLFQEVRESVAWPIRPMAHDVAYSDTGTFMQPQPAPGQWVSTRSRLSRAQLEDLAADGPTRGGDDRRVRGQVRGGARPGLRTVWSRMMRLGRLSRSSGVTVPSTKSLAEFDAVARMTFAPWPPP